MSSSSSSPAVTAHSGLATRISCWYCSFLSATSRLRSPFLLFVRLYWGWQFMQTGWGKLHHITQVISFFASLHIPAPQIMAPFCSGVEFFGGILLILGLATRLTGLVLTINMLTAYITADREALSSFFSDPGKFYAADPFTFLFAALIVLIFGAGFFSVDYWLANRRRS
jgi:putative oxidoreductase